MGLVYQFRRGDSIWTNGTRYVNLLVIDVDINSLLITGKKMLFSLNKLKDLWVHDFKSMNENQVRTHSLIYDR